MGVFVKNNEKMESVGETGYDRKENKLENLIIQNPEIFPVESISVNSRKWIPVAKQVRISGIRTDTIGIDDEGGIYIIENKLHGNNDKKTVHQQVRNYAHVFRKLIESKDGWEEFLQLIKHANESITEDVRQLSFSNKDLKEIIFSTNDMNDEKAEECFENIKKNFENGLYTLVIAIDKIPKSLRIFIDGENALDGNILPMFALEVKECKTNSNEIIIVTNTYPYDLDEIRRKVSSPRFQNDNKVFNEQFEKSSFTPEQRESFKKFRNGLDKISDNTEFNQGKSARILPRFDSCGGNRSPINLYARGKLLLNFEMLWEHQALREEFKSKLSEIEDIKNIMNIKKQSSYGIQPEVWLPHQDKILSILKEVFVSK